MRTTPLVCLFSSIYSFLSSHIHFLNVLIGQPYTRNDGKQTKLCDGQSKQVPVYQDVYSKTYHIITAKVPDGWLPGKTVDFYFYFYSIVVWLISCSHRTWSKRISPSPGIKLPSEGLNSASDCSTSHGLIG